MKAKIRLASPEQILEWSNGKVEVSDTFNYRTLKPEFDGLFCPKIFGPVNDFECLCGRYKGVRYEGIVCEKCNVKISSSIVRRERMGHIQLPVRVVHKWFFRTTNNKFALLLDMTTKELKQIINLEKYVVFNKGTTPFNDGEIIKTSDYESYSYYVGFEAETGAEALYKLLCSINFNEKIETLTKQFKESASETFRKRCHAIISICKKMRDAGVRPEWMILDKIPVLPADLRPLVELEGGQFVSSDLNELYKRVIYRSKRLESLIKAKIVVPLIIHNEIRILQNSVNRLLGSGTELEGNDGRCKSIEKRLKGKDGLFRNTTLGKRVDFSGRSPIVVAPNLKIDECFIPKEMVLELFKPILIGYLRSHGLASTIKQAKSIIDERKEIWDILQEVIKERFPVVLLNRAPTLHRIGIMAFYLKLWDKKAIGLHPLVCNAFNADFDGDQMAVHLPLADETKAEALLLMLPSKHLGSATHGGLTIGAFKDIGFGIYCLTAESGKETGKAYSSINQLEFALFHKHIKLNDWIDYLIGGKLHRTTAGRMIFWNILPRSDAIRFEDCNQPITTKIVQNILNKIRTHLGDEELAIFADKMKDIGFKYAYEFTGSIGIDDLISIEGSKEIINEAIKKQIDYIIQMQNGFVTKHQMHKQSLLLWYGMNMKGKEKIQEIVKKDTSNPLIRMLKSGARGSVEQLAQIIFMKGNVVGIDGQISTLPVWQGFKEGLNMQQYFITNRGSRNAVAKVALGTAESGYLTRRLVDAAHSCIVNSVDCKTNKHIVARNLFKDGVLQSLVYDKILGRSAAIDIESDGVIVVKRGQLIDNKVVELLKEKEITEVPIRSVVLCEEVFGVCAKCYGSDLSTGKPVDLGEAVGVIAAQSIGEPGTQLTMRSFHSGGVAKFGMMETTATTPFEGIIKFQDAKIILDQQEKMINISRDMHILVKNKKNMTLFDLEIPYGANLFVKENDEVPSNTLLASWLADKPIIAEFDGFCRFINLLHGINCEQVIDEATGKKKLSIIRNKISPFIILKSQNEESKYFLDEGTLLEVGDNTEVKKGTILAFNRHVITNVDITTGLQKVISILENRPPKNISVLAKQSGIIKIKKGKKGESIITIIDQNNKEHEYYIEGALAIQQDQQIKFGDRLTLGTPLMQDILDTKGIQVLIETFILGLINIYSQQGIKIDDKHLEVILRQMCTSYQVITPGDSDLLEGSIINISDLYKMNIELNKKNLKKIVAKIIIRGITDSALESTSFLSSASFQETINVIVNASLEGAVDHLKGLKENIIVGTLIPAGTGFAHKILQNEAVKLLKQSNDLKNN
jgi:DNA-directed RNA polymerase subunit beta'